MSNENVTEDRQGQGFPDLESLRLPQNYVSLMPTKEVLTQLRVGKPGKQEWVRVRPGVEWRISTLMLIHREEKENYLVDQGLWEELGLELVPMQLLLAATKFGVPFIWPIRLPGEDGRLDSWNESALEAARLAESSWVRLTADMALRAYRVIVAEGELGEPEWPERSFQELLEVAFKGHYIRDLEHPLIKQLRGLA